MDGLVREVVTLFAFCVVWTFIACPNVVEAVEKYQLNGRSESLDKVAKSRFARCGVYAMCSCIPLGPRIHTPYNWLVVIVVGLAVFLLSWLILKRIGH
jgi:hypothetical protein